MFCFPIVIMRSNSPISTSVIKKTGYNYSRGVFWHGFRLVCHFLTAVNTTYRAQFIPLNST